MKKGYSVHIGLNFVDPNHYDGWDGKLNACVADAEAMRDIAKKLNFNEMTVFLNEKATRKNVIDKLVGLSDIVNKGDLLLITYSGHGGQIKDLNKDEPDRIDETWCLYDAQLIDDELYSIWRRFKKGVRILVLSDSCHSGTVTKESKTEFDKYVDIYIREEKKFMPKDSAIAVYKKNKDFYDDILKNIMPRNKIQASVKLISGCQDNQYSRDGFDHGMFTAALLDVWNDGKFRGNYSDFHCDIVSQLPSFQSPNLYDIGNRSLSFDNQIPFKV